MAKYIQILDDNYKEQSEMGCEYDTKYEYLGAVVFDFTTYDGGMDSLYAKKMIPVLRAILEKKTFEYIKDQEQYQNYIAMVNMPFLTDKLEWGTSIRGAWLDDLQKYEIDCGRITIPKGELTEFITDLLQWCG